MPFYFLFRTPVSLSLPFYGAIIHKIYTFVYLCVCRWFIVSILQYIQIDSLKQIQLFLLHAHIPIRIECSIFYVYHRANTQKNERNKQNVYFVSLSSHLNLLFICIRFFIRKDRTDVNIFLFFLCIFCLLMMAIDIIAFDSPHFTPEACESRSFAQENKTKSFSNRFSDNRGWVLKK